MRSYVTDLYDLTCDGNFNRLVSVWLNLIDAYIESMKGENDISYITKINNLHITVVLPHWSKMTPQSLEIVRKAIDAGKGFLSFEMSDMFPSGGPKQERSWSGGISLSTWGRDDCGNASVLGLKIGGGGKVESSKTFSGTVCTKMTAPVTKTEDIKM